MAVRIAVDAMGGDAAPAVVVEAAMSAVSDDLEIVLVGPEEAIAEHLRSEDSKITLVDAPEVIAMDESPTAAVKSKPRSSIHQGLALVRGGDADAFVSAGNTGAVMAASVLVLGRLPGVARPALPGIFPAPSGVSVVLDVGANMDCRPEHLLQFGQMGAVYAERVLGVSRPRVGLLSVGEEKSKGNEAVKAAHALFADSDELNFVGNIEGGDLMLGAADVVVCDGFVGNVLLKFGESIKTVLPAMVRQQVGSLGDHGGDPRGLATLQQILSGVMRRFSYEEFGGTPLLGVDGTVFIGHGGSSARAIARMIEVAADAARSDMRGVLAGALAPETA